MVTRMKNDEVQSASVRGATIHQPGFLVSVRIAGVLGFAVLALLGAQVAIPVPGSPVPITMQTLTVLLAGACLGPRYGAMSMAFYLLLGTTGYHAFAHGAYGLATLFGPTGGYLLGFLLAQPVIGRLTGGPSGSARRTWWAVPAAMIAGQVVVYLCGLTWLRIWTGGSWLQAFAWGFWPFLPGEVIKTTAAAAVSPVLMRLLRPWFDRSMHAE